MIRGFLLMLSITVMTFICGGSVLVAALFGVRDRANSIYDWAQRTWARTHLWISGVRVVEHGVEHKVGGRCVFASNHVGNHDIFALMAYLPWPKFVAKAELFKIPFFGRAMRVAGMVPIERTNRRAAFGAYSIAQSRIQAGMSIAVYPEGTRGTSYALRPFKKGPFVLAIQSQAPLVPVVVHGQIAIQRKKSLKVYAGPLHIHYLPPIPTAGLSYDERDALAQKTYEAMAACLLQEYGVPSPPFGAGKGDS